MRIYALIFVHLFSELLQLFTLAEFQILNYVLEVFIFFVVQLYYKEDLGRNIKTGIFKIFAKKHRDFLKLYQSMKLKESIKKLTKKGCSSS